MNQELKKIAINELKLPSLVESKILLKAHTYIVENGEIRISKIDTKSIENIGIVYTPVKDAYFFFALYIDLTTLQILGFYTLPWNRVSFWAVIEKYSGEQLREWTTITPTIVVNKGDAVFEGTREKHNFSSLRININSAEPGHVIHKIQDLLDILETDPKGIKKLVQEADAKIVVAMEHHIGTGNLGEFELSKELMQRLVNLDLSVKFNIFAKGELIPTPLEYNLQQKRSTD